MTHHPDPGADPKEDDYIEYIPLKRRRAQTAHKAAQLTSARGISSLALVAQKAAANQIPQHASLPTPTSTTVPKTLLEQAAHEKAMQPSPKKTREESLRDAEASVMAELARQPALKTAAELAHDVVYTKPMKSTWSAPGYLLKAGEMHHEKIREMHGIVVDGVDVPPPCVSFREMKLPDVVLRDLERRGIRQPSAIQMQGLPVVLGGRDMIGVAFTGSGKTVVFTVPLVLLAWEMELRLPVIAGEGPVGMIVAPSRELARQTYDIATGMCESIRQGGGPELRTFLGIGGTRVDMDGLRKGVHIVVGTPGRLLDLLRKRRMNLESCLYLGLDEADRLIDVGFEEEIRGILSFFRGQRQTVMFSATMPRKMQGFASTGLVMPIVVNVGRAGAASLNIGQDVVVVRAEMRMGMLLDILQKTGPPTLIFCENKGDVDEIHLYLLGKGVGAVSVHGGRDQEDREIAVREFREGKKDVLVATDVAAKGLDFAEIRHVVNFDMPKEIQTYVHRIGRTGRGEKRGLATTFINGGESETLLGDLVQLLVEAGQEVGQPLLDLVREDGIGIPDTGRMIGGVKGCAYCGGLGHRIADCARLEGERVRAAGEGVRKTGTFGGDW